VNIPKKTSEFRNSLKENKGHIKISDIRKFSDFSEKEDHHNLRKERLYFSSSMVSYVNSKKNEFERIKSVEMNPVRQKFYNDMVEE
jgi:hypothetical protein